MKRFIVIWLVCLSNRRHRAGLHSGLRLTGLIVALAYCFACSSVSAAEPKQVILLSSFGREFKPWRDYTVAIRAALERRSPWPIEISDFSLVSLRRPDQNPEEHFVDYLESLFAKQPPDLIISVGAPAANFVQRHRNLLFPMAPMLFTVVEQRRVKYTHLTDNDVVVAVAHDFPEVIKNITRILPRTERILVVNGDSALERFGDVHLDKA